ncbi:sodium-dependent transporter [Eubacteriales bacterium OttesenSCG-928-N13]|nr:sodium-dependent transporter [Eubacteriales bacterium OttesenSCG-928-N13]
MREKFGSRLGFILISAGCAIGLGNVWRFPYVAAEYGGAAFIIFYLLFLLILGLPVMTMEFAVGRASRKSIAQSFSTLEPKGSKWHIFGYFGMAGNYLLMMFYTVVSGWLLMYLWRFLSGSFTPDAVGALLATMPEGTTAADAIGGMFGGMVASPGPQIVTMGIMVALGFGICSIGLKNGVERITKVMMLLLIAIMLVLSIHSITLEGAGEGLRYYLVPDFGRLMQDGLNKVLFAAMGQAFFTLSLGMGSMAIFGSYIGKDKKLLSESITITALDTFVALMAGVIIIPACFAFNVDRASGPSLLFVALPNIFHSMDGGRWWGSAFFLFMVFAALSTLVAVFENIISFGMDARGWSRKKSVAINAVAIFVLSLPALFGNNIWSAFQPLGEGKAILDLEDFIVSNNILPLGSMVYVLFCCLKSGWGYDNFLAEANTGEGISFPRGLRMYVTWVVPLIILYVFGQGYIELFGWPSYFTYIFLGLMAVGLGIAIWFRMSKKRKA